MFIGALLLVSLASTRVAADSWRWPGEETAASVQIDSKVRFVDDDSTRHKNSPILQDEELSPFSPASDTEGFYNRPGAAGRYRVLVETPRDRYQVDRDAIYPVHHDRNNIQSDGTLDSLQYCKCVSTPECAPRHESPKACGPGKYLCCYDRPNTQSHNSEYFNEIEDQRNLLHPGRGGGGGPFAPPQHDYKGYFAHRPGQDTVLLGNIGQVGTLAGPGGPTGVVGPPRQHKQNVLVGPEGPTGVIGPQGPKNNRQNQGVLVGPGGPTGSIGPQHDKHFSPQQGVFVGLSGPTGDVGPQQQKDNFIPNKGILVGPEGPSGQIGPNNDKYPRDVLVGPEGATGSIGPSASAQRGVLVGPGGSTGYIGPAGYRGQRNQRPGLLVGPGGPTGSIGPRQYNSGPAVLVGPGGPTGLIGPQQRRPVLVGPGGPTGYIGPAGYRGQRNQRPGLLVGPGGPTGSIGPGRPLLVGPGGPTGIIGPTQYGK